ncbi:response regulator [Owenweeksia hongkongensis]|uniref:response regulator n=1 Tax=Owenweeksia hongkongensis TaxID=253245 RepID=UPI003A8FA2F7
MMTQEILLVDDDPIINFINKKVVESAFPHFPIIIFENGYSAIEYIHKNPEKSFLVFLDLNMPVMNGWEFLEAISHDSNKYNLAIHILTSSVDQSDQNKANSYKQVISYLTKPLKKEVLQKIKLPKQTSFD